jgi:hypothetical protein
MRSKQARDVAKRGIALKSLVRGFESKLIRDKDVEAVATWSENPLFDFEISMKTTKVAIGERKSVVLPTEGN